MMTLCIRYTLDANKVADFEAYAQSLRKPIERCGGAYVDYYLPTKIAGPTNTAIGLKLASHVGRCCLGECPGA